jgi:hypothetical protein
MPAGLTPGIQQFCGFNLTQLIRARSYPVHNMNEKTACFKLCGTQ